MVKPREGIKHKHIEIQTSPSLTEREEASVATLNHGDWSSDDVFSRIKTPTEQSSPEMEVNNAQPTVIDTTPPRDSTTKVTKDLDRQETPQTP